MVHWPTSLVFAFSLVWESILGFLLRLAGIKKPPSLTSRIGFGRRSILGRVRLSLWQDARSFLHPLPKLFLHIAWVCTSSLNPWVMRFNACLTPSGGALTRGIPKIYIKWFSWEKLSIPKSHGCLAFRNLHAFNIAMLGKQGWKFVSQPEALVSRIFKAKYNSPGGISLMQTLDTILHTLGEAFGHQELFWRMAPVGVLVLVRLYLCGEKSETVMVASLTALTQVLPSCNPFGWRIFGYPRKKAGTRSWLELSSAQLQLGQSLQHPSTPLLTVIAIFGLLPLQAPSQLNLHTTISSMNWPITSTCMFLVIGLLFRIYKSPPRQGVPLACM